MSAIAPPPEPAPPTPPKAPATHVPTADDHLPGSHRLTARQAIATVLAALAVLVVCDGDGIRRQGEKLDQGLERTVVLAVGHPAGWIADQLPFSSAVDQMTGWLSPDEDLGSEDGSFTAPAAAGATRVDPGAFDPRSLGLAAARKPALRSLLVTGDSMSQPMDAELARALTPAGVRTRRDPKFGTGISKPDLLDWGRYAGVQAKRDQADATVVLLGANEGFPMKTPAGTVECCDARWAAEYATRVRSMMEAYRRGGRGRVYWLLIPASSDGERNRMIRVVNTTIEVAAGAFGDQVRVIDLAATLTPGFRFRSAMDVDGRTQVVRDPDGAHLNAVGGRLAADVVRRALARDFDLGAGR
ncbi:MAG TPA: hypothetical protein VD931_16100 [Baekduia sp.]|nr:hypothetical protein [Baekduia sp.]